jgi:hypothetical protein
LIDYLIDLIDLIDYSIDPMAGGHPIGGDHLLAGGGSSAGNGNAGKWTFRTG